MMRGGRCQRRWSGLMCRCCGGCEGQVGSDFTERYGRGRGYGGVESSLSKNFDVGCFVICQRRRPQSIYSCYLYVYPGYRSVEICVRARPFHMPSILSLDIAAPTLTFALPSASDLCACPCGKQATHRSPNNPSSFSPSHDRGVRVTAARRAAYRVHSLRVRLHLACTAACSKLPFAGPALGRFSLDLFALMLANSVRLQFGKAARARPAKASPCMRSL